MPVSKKIYHIVLVVDNKLNQLFERRMQNVALDIAVELISKYTPQDTDIDAIVASITSTKRYEVNPSTWVEITHEDTNRRF